MKNQKPNCILLPVWSWIYIIAVSWIGTAANQLSRVTPTEVSHQLWLRLARKTQKGCLGYPPGGIRSHRGAALPDLSAPVSSGGSPLRRLALRPSWGAATCAGERERSGTASFPPRPLKVTALLPTLSGAHVFSLIREAGTYEWVNTIRGEAEGGHVLPSCAPGSCALLPAPRVLNVSLNRLKRRET